jgi:protein-S-isoprenylcysteine O-methyltransferase Ste14
MKRVLAWSDFVLYPLALALAILIGPRTAIWYAGLIVSGAAAVLWFLARWQLGTSFSVDPEARKLVRGGLYAKFRHPIYLFGDLAYLGALLALQEWWAMLIWLAVAIEDVRRARREEAVLAEAFGAEYTAYRSRTWF